MSGVSKQFDFYGTLNIFSLLFLNFNKIFYSISFLSGFYTGVFIYSTYEICTMLICFCYRNDINIRMIPVFFFIFFFIENIRLKTI